LCIDQQCDYCGEEDLRPGTDSTVVERKEEEEEEEEEEEQL
jgi:hypothetical protein